VALWDFLAGIKKMKSASSKKSPNVFSIFKYGKSPNVFSIFKYDK
jgi:hypothetical protein